MTPGLIRDETLWAGVVDRLAPDHRCIVPRLPLGGHRRPMHPDADLSLHALADLLGEFLAVLDLRDMILVSVDWGGPQLTAARHPERLAGLVLLPEEAFDNIPPGLPGRFAGLAGRAPGGLFVAAQSLRPPPRPAARDLRLDGQAAHPQADADELDDRGPHQPRRPPGPRPAGRWWRMRARA